jgi:hypothetical protein
MKTILKNKNKFFLKIILKMGRSLWFLPIFFVFSCSINASKYGKVSLHSVGERSSFMFSVNDEFLEKYEDSKPDKEHPKLSKIEAKLLYQLLKEKNYCVNKEGETAFRITAKQEKVYDITFAHLIEQNYRAKPLTPRMFFGECVVLPDNAS